MIDRKLGSDDGWTALLNSLVLFLVLAMAIHVVLRALLGDSVPLPLDRISISRIAGAFLVGGAAAALIADALRSRVKSSVAAVGAAFLSIMPFIGAVRIAMNGLAGWTPQEAVRLVALACAAAIGMGIRWKRNVPAGAGDRAGSGALTISGGDGMDASGRPHAGRKQQD